MVSTYNKAPFLTYNFTVKSKMYQDSYIYSGMISNINKVKGFGYRYSKKSAIKASLGEHIERLCATNNYSQKKEIGSTKPVVDGFHLLTGEFIEVPAEHVFLNFNLPMFKGTDASSFYTDSCGLASHITSEDAIKGAVKEFIERQSLVANWLTRGVGEKISFEKIINKNPEHKSLLSLIKHVKTMSDQIISFNISLIKGIYVVLTIGYKGEAFSTGLGTDGNLAKAMENSLSEYLMILESCMLIKRNSENIIDSNEKYAVNFYSLTIEGFLNAFQYLFESKYELPESLYSSKTNDFHQWILDLKQLFGINLYACYLPHPLKNITSKVVKVLSPEGFPHIDTESFDPVQFEISNHLKKNDFYNKFKSIPFA